MKLTYFNYNIKSTNVKSIFRYSILSLNDSNYHNLPQTLFKISIRSMQSSRRFLGRQATNLVKRHCDSRLPMISFPKRNMSVIRVIKPDPTNTNAQATANNVFVVTKKGVIQHPEINERVCDLKDCKLKTCSKSCSRLISDRSVGHGTHGNPIITPPSTLVTISSTDLQGLPKTQNAVMYGTPHDVTATQTNSSEMQPHTTNLNNDPQALAIVKKYAK
jgi:hypothetical protein